MGKGMKAGRKKPPGAGGHGFGGGQAEQMKQLRRMQEEMAKAQEELEAKEAEASAGGGAVSVRINGKKELLEVKISPDVMDRDDPEMLQDLIIVAVNEALRIIDEIGEESMGKLTGGLGLPPGMP